MYYFLFLLLIFFNFNATCLSAATHELNFEKSFPDQTFLKMLTFESDILCAEITLLNGNQVTMSPNEPWPSLSDIKSIIFSGPDVSCKLTTQSGYELTRELHAIRLEFHNEIIDGHKEVSFELSANPIYYSESKNDPNSQQIPLDLDSNILKSILLGSQDQFHFAMKASSNTDTSKSTMSVDFKINQQNLHFDFLNNKGYKVGSWKVQSNFAEKGSLLAFFIETVQNINAASQDLIPEDYYGQTQKKIFAGLDLITSMIAPFCDDAAVGLICNGTFQQMETADMFSSNIINDFIIIDSTGYWRDGFSIIASISAGENIPIVWSQRFMIKNPAQAIERFANWVQLHGTDQLAILLEMPSISYYGYYFPKYFTQALTVILNNLGTPQKYDTLLFTVSSSTGESFQIAGIQACEFGQLFIQKIKDYANSGWGS